jgi:hypothetical protein
MKRSEATAFIKAIVAMREGATDAQASLAIPLYPILKQSGALVPVGTRINWNGQLKRAAVDLWDREENNPDNNPTLWEDINYRNGYRIIPETITVGLMFALDELGWWGDTLYKSKIPNNIHTPEQYPDGWVVYSEKEG